MNFSKQFEKAFIPLHTPNPAEVAFKVSVNYKEFTPALLPAVGSTYTAWTNKDPLKVTDWGTYVFVKMETESELLWFYWMKAKTDVELGTAFETTSGTTSKQWPPILRKVKVRIDDTVPLSAMKLVDGIETISTTPRNYVMVDYVPEVEEGGRILVKRYYGPRAHSIPMHQVPIPTSVNWDVPGADDFYRKCLHPAIAVLVTEQGAVIRYGTEAERMKNYSGVEFFPATNFLTWQRYVFQDTQSQDSVGGWLREQHIAVPPSLPETIKDKL